LGQESARRQRGRDFAEKKNADPPLKTGANGKAGGWSKKKPAAKKGTPGANQQQQGSR